MPFNGVATLIAGFGQCVKNAELFFDVKKLFR
jgi:hypothetical protein